MTWIRQFLLNYGIYSLRRKSSLNFTRYRQSGALHGCGWCCRRVSSGKCHWKHYHIYLQYPLLQELVLVLRVMGPPCQWSSFCSRPETLLAVIAPKQSFKIKTDSLKLRATFALTYRYVSKDDQE